MRTLIFSILTMLQISFFTIYSFSDEKQGKYEEFSHFFSRIEKSEIEKLLSEGRIDRYPASHLDFKLLPELKERNSILKDIEKTEFNTAIESVFYFSYPTTRDKKNIIQDSFNILTDIKKLEGITYYSYSHKEERVLFSKVEIQSGEIHPLTSAAHAETILPEKHTMTALIEDTTFGNNKYLVDYSVSDDSLVMKMSNLEKITLAFFPVVKKNGLIFYTAVIPAENGLIIYCNGISKTIDSDFIRNRIGISIYNRVTALYNWFKSNYSY